MDGFLQFVGEKVQLYEELSRRKVKHCILVGHNAKCFYIPFLLEEMRRNAIVKMIEDSKYEFAIDTFFMAEKWLCLGN